ncbi:lytic transglycosylase domain-containing protein [Sedimentitalea sp. JM2-8]|uniref:Lytic transglycosylase domain-containing protein n=1 Tax=Sedimentitalea xiamensis TaxID=3050037 RepID=A0ABT7FFY4_9RHOB|nr:lytic transglycosylase domain-containing protein [Sedimentitalea xiamensis]MDK3074051.1 lytic transglycosylase domain-containing protein [Sedimentitalea xiamensis]
MLRNLAIVLCLNLLFLDAAWAEDATRLSRAMEAMRKSDWDTALTMAGKQNSVARDIIEWNRLRAGLGDAADVAAFLERRPDWPGLEWLRRKSESAMTVLSAEQTLAFYDETPPQSPEGVLTHARALIANGQRGDGEAELVLAWRTMPMGSNIQADYLSQHRSLLAPHHNARLDRMLWDGHKVSARQMLSLVDDSHRALAEARMSLQDMEPGVDNRIAAVPTALQNTPGLAHDRFVWRDRKGRDSDAIELLLERSASAATLGEPRQWAGRRANLARQQMRAGDASGAYKIASRHFLTDGADYADLEWLSGFLALRFLNDPATALRHFQNLDAAVETPISKGRAGYWMGRAHAALGDADNAHAAYAMGAEHQTSFYGLLAAERIGRPFDPVLAHPPELPPWKDAPFMSSSVLQAGLLLLEADQPNLGERFLTHLVESLDPVQAGQLGDMAVDLGRPHLAVMIAKRAASQGMVLPAAYYPLHPLAKETLPMAPEMNLAIARRESEFDPTVISGAGARGLMQVMPATAVAMATEMGILSNHDTENLTRDWQYNAKLGARYLAGLAGGFNGNVVMMAAGYNAGPGRPLQWMLDYGDPRTGAVDIVDWIEFIPFSETRNYVMRVTESLPIYRARLGLDPLPIPFTQELTGSTLRAFAP